MKQFCCSFTLLICVLILLTGCSNNGIANKNNSVTWDLTNVEPIYITEWSENEYTAQIIKPKNGEIEYVYDCSDSGCYAIFMKDISEEESADYIKELKEQGYLEIASEGNDASAGTILKKDNIALSISYSRRILSMTIVDSEFESE